MHKLAFQSYQWITNELENKIVYADPFSWLQLFKIQVNLTYQNMMLETVCNGNITFCSSIFKRSQTIFCEIQKCFETPTVLGQLELMFDSTSMSKSKFNNIIRGYTISK